VENPFFAFAVEASLPAVPPPKLNEVVGFTGGLVAGRTTEGRSENESAAAPRASLVPPLLKPTEDRFAEVSEEPKSGFLPLSKPESPCENGDRVAG
jgi:hypothetical protein